MKKIALTMAFLLSLCSFTACGKAEDSETETSKGTSVSSEEETSVTETTTEAETTEEETTETETTEAETTRTEESKAEETTAKAEKSDIKKNEADNGETTASQPAAAENTDFKRGVVDDDVYISEYGGIKFKAPEGWTFAKDDYILSMMNIGLDIVASDNAAVTKAMLEQIAIYDALCMDEKTGQSILVQYENLAKEVPDPDKFTMDDYFAATDKLLSSMDAFKYTKKGEPETVTFAGKEFQKVVYTAEYAGFTMEQIYYVRRRDKCIQIVAFSSGMTGGDMTEYEKYFESIE